MVLLVVACLMQWMWYSKAYHVLVISPVPSPSHNTLGRGIVDALLQAGHQVTWATAYPLRETVTGLSIIDVSATIPITEGTNFADPKNSGLIFARQMSRNVSQTAIRTPALREAIIKSNFDAVVTEPFFSDADCGYAAVLQVPWIPFLSVPIQPYMEMQVDDVRHLATVPMLMNHATIPMGFWRRLFNSFIYTVMSVERWLDHLTTKSFYESQFGPLSAARGVTLPDFYDAFYNISILLVNSHPSLSPTKSLPPNVVEIGGFHIKNDTPPLPEDLLKLLDSSPQGVVYFSMGSILKSADFSAVTIQELLKVLGELPYTVLWKFEEQFEDRPRNVHIRKWMPQASILSHPHTKLFITHGGILSVSEAVYYGVPLITIPVYGDQGTNAVQANQLGIARTVGFGESMALSLQMEVNEILANDSYHERVKYLSKLYRKRPEEPSKLIAHYIEVAIESRGAYHLRSKSLLYCWYQRWMLDQLAALLLFLTIIFFGIRWTLRIIIHRIRIYMPVKNKVKKCCVLFMHLQIHTYVSSSSSSSAAHIRPTAGHGPPLQLRGFRP